MSQESFIVLQKENHALTRENSELHLELIRMQEELDAKSKAALIREKELQDKIQELQFLNTQKTSQLQKKDNDLSKLYAQIQRLQTESGNHESIEINRHLPQPTIPKVVPTPSNTTETPSDDEVLRQKQVDSLKRENKALQDKFAVFETQIRAREAEIERLGKQLRENIQTKDYTTAKAKYDLEAKEIAQDIEKEHLERQVDFLNDQVAKYEQKLEELHPAIQRTNLLTNQLSQARELNESYLAELESLRYQLNQLEQERLLCASKATETTQAADAAQATLAQVQADLADSKAQIMRLEHALKATHYDKVSSSNSVANLEAHIKILTTELNQLKPVHKDSINQLNQMQLSNDQLTRQLDSLEKELATMQSKLSSSLATHDADTEVISTLRRECSTLESAIQDRDKQIRQLQGALDTAQQSASSLELQKKQAEASYTQDTQRAMDMAAHQSSIYAEERASLRKDNETLRANVRQLQLDRKETQQVLETTRHDLDQHQRLSEQLQRQFNDKLVEIDQLQSQLKQLKVELVHAHEDIARLEVRIAEKENEPLPPPPPPADGKEWQKRLHDVLLAKQEIETQLSAAKTSKASLEVRLTKNTASLRAAEEAASRYQAEIAQLQQRVATLEGQVLSSKQSKTYFENEYQAAMQAWTDQSSELQLVQHQLEAAETQQQLQSRQLDETKAALQKAQTKGQQLENLLEQAQSSRKAIEMQWTLLQEELRHAKEHQVAREAQIKRLQIETGEQAKQLLQLEKDNDQLKHLVAEMDYARDNWTLKQKQLSLDVAQLRDDKSFLEKQIEQLHDQEKRQKAQLSQMKSVLEAMDREKDKLIVDLDRKTEELNMLQTQNVQANQEHTAIRSQLQECQLALHRLESALQEKEMELGTSVAQLNQAESTARTLKQDVDLLKAEQVALQQDLHHMTVENQSLAGECATLHHELDQVGEDQRALRNHIHQVERERESYHIELEDLKQTYRALVVEMDALEVTRSQLTSTREELGSTNSHLRRHIQDLTRERDDAIHKANELEAQEQVFSHQIKELTLQLQRLQDKDAANTRSQALLSGALSSQHQVATELAHERVESAAHNSSLNQRLAYLQAQLNNSVHDRTQLANQVNQLNLDKHQLETLLASVRSQVATLQVQIEQLQEEKSALVQELTTQASPPSDRRRAPSSSHSQNESSPDAMPSLQEAEERCRKLEERLSRQDATIQQLEQSRSKFRKFAAKYESELQQRDRVIEALRSSQRSSSSSTLSQRGQTQQHTTEGP
ncbi:unnamed protein product [Aphanomyces euteiches]|nr:hypothetical protein Ae201684P_019622 [Aphanomyces euteiches]